MPNRLSLGKRVGKPHSNKEIKGEMYYEAMATQFFPDIAMMAPPLYSRMD